MPGLRVVVSPDFHSLIEQGLLLSWKEEMIMPLQSLPSVSSALCVLQPSRPFQNVWELIESAVAIPSPSPRHTQHSQRRSCRPSCSHVPRGAPRSGATTPPSGGGQGIACGETPRALSAHGDVAVCLAYGLDLLCILGEFFKS